MKVLLIESSQLYLAYLTKLFEEFGFEPVIANDLATASSRLARGKIDLVCTNRFVPGGDAVDFVTDVRALVDRVPVLMLTSDRSAQTRAEALGAGITEVIYKASMPEMSARIRSFVTQHLESRARRGRVLYVEDSRTEALVVRRTLEAMGLEIDHFRSAEEAIESLERVSYDLVISDVLLLGEKSGLSLVAHIRSLDADRARVPVLTLTGFDDIARRIELLRAGTNDYIVKPVIPEELTVRVSNLIDNKQLMDKVIAQQAQLHALAVTDQLTGCANRRGFREYTDHYLSDSATGDEWVGLLLLDLDHFKKINDTHGHDAGDRVLDAVGRALREACRDTDLVSRFGGEEFVVFLADCDKKHARQAAERIRRRIARLEVDGIRVTTSIGATALPARGDVSLERALSIADQAAYTAKERGRNRVSFRSIGKR